MSICNVAILIAARQVADYAEAEGASGTAQVLRPSLDHMGAIVADAVLQAGLNYATVVRPRVLTILQDHPTADRVSTLARLVEDRQVVSFLNWEHPTKVERFERLVLFLESNSVETSVDLREQMGRTEFREALKEVNGIGPKTVDYIACLVGLDSIAVDRHVRTFASRAGVQSEDYDFLREVFCSAADLLSVSRRAFDSWVWRRESAAPKFSQLALDLVPVPEPH